MRNLKILILSGLTIIILLGTTSFFLGCKQKTDGGTVTVSVTEVKLDKTTLSLVKDTTGKLNATVLPSNAANKKVTWSSNKAEIAEVDQEGTVTAKAIGEAEITVTTQDGGKTAKCILQVKGGSDFVLITPPEDGIIGKKADYEIPNETGTSTDFQGVFTENRKVKLSPYFIGKYEVTYKLWAEVYNWAVANGYKFQNSGAKGSKNSGSELQPVVFINNRDCIVWCNAYTAFTATEKGNTDECVYLKSKTDPAVLKDAVEKNEGKYVCDYAYADMGKKGFRLPTEAEWEFAARWQGEDGENAERYGSVFLTKLNTVSGAKVPASADNIGEIGKFFWFKDNSGGITSPVGKKEKNMLGLYDMSGNVFELIFDLYSTLPSEGDGKYKDSEGFIVNPAGPEQGKGRVLKSGSFFLRYSFSLVGYRYNSYVKDGISNDQLGFRLVFSK